MLPTSLHVDNSKYKQENKKHAECRGAGRSWKRKPPCKIDGIMHTNTIDYNSVMCSKYYVFDYSPKIFD